MRILNGVSVRSPRTCFTSAGAGCLFKNVVRPLYCSGVLNVRFNFAITIVTLQPVSVPRIATQASVVMFQVKVRVRAWCSGPIDSGDCY